MGLVINFSVDDQLDFSGEWSWQAIAMVMLDDGLSVADVLTAEGDLCWLTLSLDTDRLFPAMHSFPYFNSFCEIDGTIYAAGSDGIHRLSGDTDNGSAIHTGVIWDRTDFGMSNQKRLRAAMLLGNVGASVMQAADDSGRSSIFPVSRGRAAIGRNLIGRNWSVRVADFERLESIEFFPVVLGR